VEYVRRNLMKEKLDAGEVVSGMEMWLRDPRIVELMAQAGYDFFQIENEHVANDWSAIENYARIADGLGMTTVFRTEQCFHGEIPANQIIKALKCGIQVIKVPHVENAVVARKIVEAVKYPPLGGRGLATCDRSAAFVPATGAEGVEVGEFVRQANEQTQIWALIESVEGVEKIDEIVATDGIDVVAFGHQDYAISAGLASDKDPAVAVARTKVREAALGAGKHMYFQASDAESVKREYDNGVRIFLMFVDLLHLNNKLHEVIHWTDGIQG
jgi:4-hydroxy-2-oxoheptanedioate aldolase